MRPVNDAFPTSFSADDTSIAFRPANTEPSRSALGSGRTESHTIIPVAMASARTVAAMVMFRSVRWEAIDFEFILMFEFTLNPDALIGTKGLTYTIPRYTVVRSFVVDSSG